MATSRERKEITRVEYVYGETSCDLCGAWENAVDYMVPFVIHYNADQCVSMYLRKDICDICWKDIDDKYRELMIALRVNPSDIYDGRFDTDEKY